MHKKSLLSAVAIIVALISILTLVGCSNNSSTGEDSTTDASQTTEASTYPEKAITMIVPYGAGGTTDITGRQFSILLSKYLGQPITVINQAGASGSIGAKTVLDANPDGYTILYTADSLGTQRVMGISEMSYADFTPIMAVVNDPKVIVVSKNSPYETLEDLCDAMIESPGTIKMSYTGPGGSGHVQELIYNKFGLEMATTAYSSGSDALLAVLGEQVDFTNANYSSVIGYLESGDLKLLGVSSNTRLNAYPDVPTLSEIIPEAREYIDMPFTPLSLLVDKDVPSDVVTVLTKAAAQVIEDPEWIEFVQENELEELYKLYPTQADILKFYADWESQVSWLLYDAGAAQLSPEDFGIPKPE